MLALGVPRSFALSLAVAPPAPLRCQSLRLFAVVAVVATRACRVYLAETRAASGDTASCTPESGREVSAEDEGRPTLSSSKSRPSLASAAPARVCDATSASCARRASTTNCFRRSRNAPSPCCSSHAPSPGGGRRERPYQKKLWNIGNKLHRLLFGAQRGRSGGAHRIGCRGGPRGPRHKARLCGRHGELG
jgi:hypothetical protein